MITNPEELSSAELFAAIEKKEQQILKVTGGTGCDDNVWQFSHRRLLYLENLLSDRLYYLNHWFLRHITDNDVKRFEEINKQLLEMTHDLYKRAAQTYRVMSKHPEVFPEEETWLEVGLECCVEDEEDVLPDPENHFGTELSAKVIPIVMQLADAQAIPYFSWVRQHINTNHLPEMTDAEMNLIDTLDDGDTWADGALFHPCFNHICICYAAHAICTHQHYAIPDLLRVKRFNMNFNIERQAKIDFVWECLSIPAGCL